MYYLKMFGLSLLMTLLVEGFLGFFLGMKSIRQQKLMALVNILTNPAAVLLCWLGIGQIPVELGVIATECWIYYSFSQDTDWKIAHPIRLGIVLNLVSWFIGIIIGGCL